MARSDGHREWPRTRIVVLILTIGAASALVGSVVFSNLPLDGRLRVFAVPGRPSPFFGGFLPENRVRVFPEAYAELKNEPIYFSMAVPAFFRSATVRLEYRNLGQPVIELGARASHEDWAFMLKPIEADVDALENLELRETFLKELATTPEPATTSDGWRVSETVFDFGPLAVDERGDVQMVVSLPGMKATDAMPAGRQAPVLIRSIHITYERPPLTLVHIVEALRGRIAL